MHRQELWIADRNFGTRAILAGWHRRRSSLIVREHGHTPNPTACAAPHACGRIDTGNVAEQAVSIPDEAHAPLALRRTELALE